jgi:hypothetical protein
MGRVLLKGKWTSQAADQATWPRPANVLGHVTFMLVQMVEANQPAPRDVVHLIHLAHLPPELLQG